MHKSRAVRAKRHLNAPEVVECHNIKGKIGCLLLVKCADLCAYKSFHTNLPDAFRQVDGITSYVVMRSLKDECA